MESTQLFPISPKWHDCEPWKLPDYGGVEKPRTAASFEHREKV